MSFVCCLIDTTIMNSSLEMKFAGTKNLIDMTFINLTSFRVTLKTTLNRKNMGSVDIRVVTLFPPLRISIIYTHISRHIRIRTVSKSIFDVTTINLVIINSSKGKNSRWTG